MGAPKGNQNAFKNGLYARYIPAQDVTGLEEMPSDQFISELKVLRFLVTRGLGIFNDSPDFETQMKSLSFCSIHLNRIINAIFKLQLRSGKKIPEHLDFWSSVNAQNREDGLDKNLGQK